MNIASFMVSWLHSTCQNDGLHRAESLDSLHNGEKQRKSNTMEEKTNATQIKHDSPTENHDAHVSFMEHHRY